MAVGRLRCVVIDVDDLTVAERFWSEMTGLPVIASNYTGRLRSASHAGRSLASPTQNFATAPHRSAGHARTASVQTRRTYLVHFPDLAVMKVGLTHDRHDRRLLEHQLQGGDTLATVVVPDRPTARRVERYVRAQYAP